MKLLNILVINLIAIFFIFIFPFSVNANQIKTESYYVCSDRLVSIKQYLSINSLLKSYNSPLISNSHVFVSVCKTNSINCYLLPSIAGLESSFGKFIVPHSYNPFGWGKGLIRFNSWDQSIHTVGSSLKKAYIDQGLLLPDQISRKYAPNSTTWYIHVDYFMKKLYNEQAIIDRYLSIIKQI